MLLRGEVVWVKAKGAAGSCAFGSYMKASNPVLRDLSERVVIASKGRFDRAIPAKERAKLGLPHESDISKEEFLASTLDVWEIRPERARRVNHPAPFPVELPERFIHLYTYVDDVVLDPFLGSGSTAVAAVGTGRRYVGYDLDPDYVAIAEGRIAEARASLPTDDAD
jgi:site-specific DNA-methyltransferase (adenine-specific)